MTRFSPPPRFTPLLLAVLAGTAFALLAALMFSGELGRLWP